jgi:hypothetical protein
MRLQILTWNVWMMPWWTFQSPRNTPRAAAIAAELLQRDFDILCLEKVFDSGARKVLARALASHYPYQYGPANASCALKVHSGVWVVSRFPLTNYHAIQFRYCAGIECFSRKGVMLLTGIVEGRRFQILATHLQGEEGPHYTPEHQKVRNQQMAQVRDELLAPYAEPGVPLFLSGDFGTPRRDESDPSRESASYRLMLQTFGAANGPEDRNTLDDNRSRNDVAIDNTGRTDELDYILVRPNGVDLQTQWSRLILRHPGWDGRKGRQDLSYRYAVGATIEWR